MGIQKDARAPTQRQLPLPDPIEEQRAAYRAEIVTSAGKHRADVEAMLKLRGSALYDRMYRFLLKLKLESYKPEDAYRMRTSPELGVLVRVLAEGTQNAPEDVMSAALLSLCERRSGEDIWDLNALRGTTQKIKSSTSTNNAVVQWVLFAKCCARREMPRRKSSGQMSRSARNMRAK